MVGHIPVEIGLVKTVDREQQHVLDRRVLVVAATPAATPPAAMMAAMAGGSGHRYADYQRTRG